MPLAGKWAIWVDWPARSDWLLVDGAQRLARALRLVHRTIPEGTERFTVGTSNRASYDVADPELTDRLAPALRRTRNTNLFRGTDLLGDANVMMFPDPPAGLAVVLSQVATGAGWHEGRCRVDFWPEHVRLLTERGADIAALVAELGAIFEARNAWVDMAHVRLAWNRWKDDCPVYGWATWLHPQYATVDTAGLDVDATEAAGGGRLIVLRSDPLAMADPDAHVGESTIRELARRTVFADGRRLIDVNPAMREPAT
jgi:hypothetical protein